MSVTLEHSNLPEIYLFKFVAADRRGEAGISVEHAVRGWHCDLWEEQGTSGRESGEMAECIEEEGNED